MQEYKPDKALIFVHIPKCGGTSVDHVLNKWFGQNFFRHGFNKWSRWYRETPYPLEPGTCISGHFDRTGDRGLNTLYPGAEQLITFLRDPFETKLSQYFFWKIKRRQIKIDEGSLEPGSEHDYRNITDFFEKRSESYMLNFLPAPPTMDNYKDILHRYFIHIGIVEELQASLDRLADQLGFPRAQVEHRNRSPHDEPVPPGLRDEFVRNNPLEYAVYNYIKNEYTPVAP